MLSLELCRCSSDIYFPVQQTTYSTGLATTSILLGMVEARSVDVKSYHTFTPIGNRSDDEESSMLYAGTTFNMPTSYQ